MSFVLANQTLLFFQSIVLGVILSAFYDLFFVARNIFPAKVSPHVLLDILYFMLVGVILFDYVLTENHGRMRYFIALGAIIGWVIYHLTVSRLVVKAVTWIFGLIGKIIRWILSPFWPIVHTMQAFFKKQSDNIKRKEKELKYDLQRRSRLLYNKSIKRQRKGKTKA